MLWGAWGFSLVRFFSAVFCGLVGQPAGGGVVVSFFSFFKKNCLVVDCVNLGFVSRVGRWKSLEILRVFVVVFLFVGVCVCVFTSFVRVCSCFAGVVGFLGW